jgi:hypothetical protein
MYGVTGLLPFVLLADRIFGVVKTFGAQIFLHLPGA